MKKLRAVVVGVGYLGRFHAQKYASLKDEVELVGVCDSFPDQASKVAQELGVKAFTKTSDFLGQVDIATVATPTSHHFKVAKELLECGVHLLVEKPLTVTSGEADELMRLAERKDLVLQVGHIERFNPTFIELRKQVREPEYFEAFRLAPFKARALDVDVVTDLMIHDIDLMLTMMPYEIVKIEAHGQSVMTNTIDIAHANFYFKNGKKAHISVSRCHPHAVRSVSAYTDRHHYYADLGNLTLHKVERKARDLSAEPVVQSTVTVEKQDALFEETKAFVKAVKTNGPAVVPAQDGLRAIRVLERVLGIIRG